MIESSSAPACIDDFGIDLLVSKELDLIFIIDLHKWIRHIVGRDLLTFLESAAPESIIL